MSVAGKIFNRRAAIFGNLPLGVELLGHRGNPNDIGQPKAVIDRKSFELSGNQTQLQPIRSAYEATLGRVVPLKSDC